MRRNSLPRRIQHATSDVVFENAYDTTILRPIRRRSQQVELRRRPQMPVSIQRQWRDELDQNLRLMLVVPAAGAQRSPDARLEIAPRLVRDRRAQVDHRAADERREGVAPRLERVMPVLVVADLSYAVHRAECARHNSLDDGQNRSKIVLQRHAEIREHRHRDIRGSVDRGVARFSYMRRRRGSVARTRVSNRDHTSDGSAIRR